ncbi:hypothetical protein [Limnoglobus roseus]|uniref:Uncharacterized protein n=1 Tax=Limnoglobus roseus TaxID=2598579 RepID=A0A5C1A8Q9_9BACT|nr:hypothetical protein [Limnoglobus roseus]QEL14396.1 hypothetical protein PX52LOC_01284 [Limnoglobus roseus]
MTRRSLHSIAAGLFAVGVAGCSPSPPPPAEGAAKAEVPVPVVAEPPKEQPKVQPPEAVKPVPPKLEPFRYPDDAAGKQVEQALTPALPAEKPSRVTAPRPRVSEVDRGELPTKKPTVPAAPLPMTPRKSAVPPPPREGVPATVGVGNEMPLQDTKLPEGPSAKAPSRPEPTAVDVPRMATQLPDRVPTDDPTAEISTHRIVNTLMPAPTITVPFLRLLLPDPFEFAEQLKAPPAPEFATTPVLVPPARP